MKKKNYQPDELNYELSGEVATLSFHIEGFNENQSPYETKDKELYSWAVDNRKHIEDLIRDNARKYLGDEYTVNNVTIEHGSVTITAVITTAGIIYYGFSRYKNFIDSIDLLQKHLSWVFNHLFRHRQPRIAIQSTVSPILPQNISLPNTSLVDTTSATILYLILSNAGLIAVISYLLIRRLHY